MRIVSVTAYAFGPLAGETLELAPGLTVVHGPNESAKSTWHAAMQAAVCGRRRGRGRQSADEAAFAERHRPWDRDAWEVGAQLVLDDGRRVELRHDLDGRADCHATDLDLGTELTSEIVHEGAPDASRWLGLDRAAFVATASIGQAQLLDVLERAGALQEHIQRAAATAGTDETAAAAIAAIDTYRREHVGTDARNSTRPLRKAVEARLAARHAVETARTAREDFERRVAQVAELRTDANGHDRVVALHEAAAAIEQVRRLRGRADAAAGLDARLGGAEPSRGTEDLLAGRVTAALAAWRARPPVPSDDDDAPATTMAPAGRAATLTEEELFDLAQRLDEGATTPPDPRMEARVLAARLAAQQQARARRRARLSATTAVALLLGGVALYWYAGFVPAAIAVVLAAGLGFVAVRAARSRPEAVGELAAAEKEHADAQWARKDLLNRRRQAEARCAELGVPADPELLRQWARQRAGGAQVRHFRQQAERVRAEAAALVLDAATECGLPATQPEAAVAALEDWERERAARDGEHDRARVDWARLTAVLDGRPLSDLLADVEEAENRAAKAADGFSESELATVRRIDDEWLRELQAVARAASARSVGAEGSLDERARVLPSLAEAEEALVRAEAEEARVRDLDGILARTRQFLDGAQERVHRDIAPRLAASVRRALPELTGGRYTDAIVDPQTLGVRVRGPQSRLRQAHLLSHGTAEQVYLLLRIALAEHLTRPGTRCPLLLDDVTVHADAARAQRILELLLVAAADRQIVLFTQQDQVRDWARVHATPPRHALVELPPVTV